MAHPLFLKRPASTLLVWFVLTLYIAVPKVHAEAAHEGDVELLKGQDWSHLAGATTTPEGIRITAVGSMIIHQDGSIPQPNPPVNFRGPQLRMSGDFTISATIEGASNGAVVRLYGEKPNIYDEWRHEGASLEIALSSSTVVARIWNGTASTPMDIRTFPQPLPKSVRLEITHQNGDIKISTDGHLLGSMPDHAIFSLGTILFGASAPTPADWTLKTLTAHAIGQGHVELVPVPSLSIPHTDPLALRNLARALPRPIPIGTSISTEALFTDRDYREQALQQFNIFTPENALKAQFVHPQRNVYAFGEADNLTDVALANDASVHGHTLVYGKANPDWMSTFPKAQRESIMRDHVKTIVSHFGTRVAEWDVVNEPMSNNEKDRRSRNGNRGLESTIWFQAMGERYIDIAFNEAHRANPRAILYVNDYGLENKGARWDTFLSLIRRLQARKVPISGVGFEAHVYHDTDIIDVQSLRAHMRILASLGLKVRVSEIDVYGDNRTTQATQYANVLRACLLEPNCTSYTTWGLTDRYGSTTRADRYPLVTGNSLLFDRDLKPKEAFRALQKVLK